MIRNPWHMLTGLTLEHAWQSHRRRLWTAVLAGLILVSFAGNLGRGLLETTEGRYAECALEMLANGTYLEPTLDVVPHWTKPPMAYWSMAAGMLAVGPGEAGARLGTSVAFVCAGLVTAWLAWRLWGEMAALAALAVYATSVLPLLGSTFLSTDMLLTLWETLGVTCYVLWSLNPDSSRTLLVTMWAAFGMAFLTKGPPGLLPLLAIIPWHVWRFRNGRIFPPAGLALFSLLALGWFAIILTRHPDLLSYYLKEELVGRLTSDTFHRNPQWWKPLVIYFPVLFLGQLHWAWMLGDPRTAWQAMPREQRIFMGVWLMLPLTVFCLAKSRLPLYVLPLSIPLTLCIAHGLVQRRNRIQLRAAAAVFAGAILVTITARAVLGILPLPQNMRHLHEKAVQAGAGELVGLVKEKAYGLQFYAGGRMTWLGVGGGDRAQKLRDFLDTASGKYRLVARSKDEALITGALAAEGLNGTRTEYPEWVVVSFEK